MFFNVGALTITMSSRQKKEPSPEPEYDFFKPHPHPTKVRVINSMFGNVPDAFEGKTLELGGDSRKKKMSQDTTATPPPEPESKPEPEPEPEPVQEEFKPSVASEVKAEAWDTSDGVCCHLVCNRPVCANR